MTGCSVTVGVALLILVLGGLELAFRPLGAGSETLAFIVCVALAVVAGSVARRLFAGRATE